MRNLLIIAMVVGGAFMAGWFKINRDGDSTTIEINRAEIRSDARAAIDRGKNILDKREQDAAQREMERQQIRNEQDRYADRSGGYPQQPSNGYQNQGYSNQAYPPQPSQGGGYQNPGYQNGPTNAPWNQNYGQPNR